MGAAVRRWGRRLFVTAVIYCGFNAVMLAQPWPVPQIVEALNPAVLFSVDTDQKVVALTIDDGPHPAVTPGVLDLLHQYHAHATFFVNGRRAARYPDLTRRIVAEGHELGNHMMGHWPGPFTTPARFEREYLRADSILARFSPDVHWLRPATGWFVPSMITRARRHGYRLCLGRIFPQDWKLHSVWWISQYVLWKLQPGGIIILHDGAPDRYRTVRVLRIILPEMERRGYRVVTVSELAALRRKPVPSR